MFHAEGGWRRLWLRLNQARKPDDYDGDDDHDDDEEELKKKKRGAEYSRSYLQLYE